MITSRLSLTCITIRSLEDGGRLTSDDGDSSIILDQQRSAVYWMGDISWPRYALGIPFGLFSALWTFTYSHSFLIIYLSLPLIPTSQSILGP